MWVQGDLYRAKKNDRRAADSNQLSLHRITSDVDDISITDDYTKKYNTVSLLVAFS